MTAELATVDEAVGALGRGEMVDAADRENEGDLVLAAEHVTAPGINFMATHGRGLICVPMLVERLEALGIGPMAAKNTDPKGTASTSSSASSAPRSAPSGRSCPTPPAGCSRTSRSRSTPTPTTTR
jgi:hypothetical protein